MNKNRLRECIVVGMVGLGVTFITLATLVWISVQWNEWVSMTITFLAERWALFLDYPSGTIQVLLWTGVFILMITWLVFADPYE